MKEELQKVREDYTLSSLHKNDLKDSPIEQFEDWFKQYQQTGALDYNAMVLSTINKSGTPKSRVVLLKGLDKGGFEFYTNYLSQKGEDIAHNAQVALNFFWAKMERQVRVEGEAVKLEPSESDQYFHSRPIGSQIGAWASPQSQVIPDRKVLEQRLEELSHKYGHEIPRPDFWGGYRIIPNRVEFWQGRSNRLHDRLVYVKNGEGWDLERLAP